MEAVAATAAPVDEARARPGTGDLTAFIALYQPHVAGVYDFALRAVRDRDVAAGVVRRTFVKAWEAFPERGSDVRDWLYAVVRDHAAEALRYRERRNGADREGLDFTQVDAERVPDPSGVLFDREFAELVWDTAATLSLEEYSLLALHVRHDVALDEAGETRSARLRAAFDERVTSELVVRRGHRVCAELNALVVDAAGERSLEQHIRDCERCQAGKRSFVSPTAVLGALAPIPPAPDLEAELLRELRKAARGQRPRRFGIL